MPLFVTSAKMKHIDVTWLHICIVYFLFYSCLKNSVLVLLFYGGFVVFCRWVGAWCRGGGG